MTSKWLRAKDTEKLRMTVPIEEWPKDFLMRHVPEALPEAGYCVGGHWPVEEYGQRCPSCVFDEQRRELGEAVQKPGPLPAVGESLRAGEASAVVEEVVAAGRDPVAALRRWLLVDDIVSHARDVMKRARMLSERNELLHGGGLSEGDLEAVRRVLREVEDLMELPG